MIIEGFVSKKARQFNLDPDLVRAIIYVESNDNSRAMRYEPNYKWLYKFINPAATKATEEMQQSTSWGCMQVMGATARELGCDKPWLNCLLDVPDNLHYGCLYLSSMIHKYGLDGGISAYNQGGPRKCDDGTFRNQPYVDRVFDKVRELKGELK